jgi:hypothetical protein
MRSDDEDENIHAGEHIVKELPAQKSSLSVSKAIAFRLIDPNDILTCYVRDLHVGPLDEAVYDVFDQFLVNILRNLKNLNNFR